MRSLLSVLCILLFAGPATADPERIATYERLLSSADQAFDAGQFADARALYQQAFDIHADPTLLYNIASCYRREGDDLAALSHYEKLDLLIGSQHPLKDVVRQAIIDMREEIRLTRVKRSVPDSQLGTFTHVLDLRDLPELGSTLPIVEYKTPGKKPLLWAAAGTASAGVLALGYGVYTGVRAENLRKDLAGLDVGDAWDHEQFVEAKALTRRAILFSSVGGAALLTGGVLYYLGRPRTVEGPPLSVQVNSGGVSLAVMGKF